MKKLTSISVILALALALSSGTPTSETAWKGRAVYDSLVSGGISGAADTVKLINWQESPGGHLAVILVTTSFANSGTAPTVNFKYRLREKQGDYSWVQCTYASAGTGGVAATNLTSSSVLYLYVGYLGAALVVDSPTTIGQEIYMIITKNNWTTGYLDAWAYWKQD